MKIAILTQPLHSNYGGLLQAWALQRTLTDIGHEATILNRTALRKPRPLWRRFLSNVKMELLILSGQKVRYVKISDELKRFSEQYVRKFQENRYLGVSPLINSEEELRQYVESQNFDAFVVGSDQVWRPMYSPHLMTFFLDFVKDNDKVKKIAYAASFGVDEWEFSDEETKQAAELAPLFDVISVRESSGVRLVEQYLNCKATHVLDPTMLLEKQAYIDLVGNPTCQLKESEGDLFAYVLDKSEYITDAINRCSATTGFKPFYCNYSIPVNRLRPEDNMEAAVVPPVEQWLKSFMDAKMVITDSFHGMVFSIIFNKPFWIILNEGRGSARFLSLLNELKLKDRIITNPASIDWNKRIDWVSVNNKRQEWAVLSKSLLQRNLNM